MIGLGDVFGRAACGGIATAAVLTLSGAALAQQHVAIKGGQIGGAFNRWTSAWSIYLPKAIDGVQFSSESSTGSPENMRAVGSGDADFGLVFASDLFNGYRGHGNFEDPITNIGAMTYVFASVGHFVVPEDSEIQKLEDIAGKRVSLGGPGSGSAENITLLLQEMGIWDDFNPVYLGGDSPQALSNGEIDAFNWHPGLGNSVIHEAASMMDIRFVNLDQPASASGFYEAYPYFGPMIIPGGLYSGVDEDTPTFGTGSILIANSDVSEDFVYDFLKAIYSDEGRAELSGAVGPALIEAMTEESALDFVTVPLHPGAERFWKEQGVTIPEELRSQ
jgi:TRAP transporter TAXI family solute receptor